MAMQKNRMDVDMECSC